MNNLQIRKLNKYQAEKAYMTDNAAAFPDGSPGAGTLAAQPADSPRAFAKRENYRAS